MRCRHCGETDIQAGAQVCPRCGDSIYNPGCQTVGCLVGGIGALLAASGFFTECASAIGSNESQPAWRIVMWIGIGMMILAPIVALLWSRRR